MEQYLTMKKLLLTLALLLWPGFAWAQCTGVFQPNSLCGNVGPSAAPPHQITGITSVFGPATTTSGQIPTWLGSTGVQLADPASITTSQNLNLTGQTSIFSGAITSAQITSAAITNLGVTSQFLYKGVPYTFPPPITSAVTSVTVSGALTLTGITSVNITPAPGAILTPTTSVNFASSNLTGAMAGYGSVCTLTPKFSTRALVNFNGGLTNSGASDGAVAFIYFGLTPAPTTSSAITGTNTNAEATLLNNASTAAVQIPFSLTATLSNLTPGTAYWFDLKLQPTVGGVATIVNVSCSALEF